MVVRHVRLPGTVATPPDRHDTAPRRAARPLPAARPGRSRHTPGPAARRRRCEPVVQRLLRDDDGELPQRRPPQDVPAAAHRRHRLPHEEPEHPAVQHAEQVIRTQPPTSCTSISTPACPRYRPSRSMVKSPPEQTNFSRSLGPAAASGKLTNGGRAEGPHLSCGRGRRDARSGNGASSDVCLGASPWGSACPGRRGARRTPSRRQAVRSP